MVTAAALRLCADSLELVLRPAIGGSIARFDHVTAGGRQPLMRPAPDDAHDVLAMASFPLVPFANRIRGGRFTCDGATISLSPNLAGDPSPLHGQGWRSAWHVEDASEAAARLAFQHEPGEWPWRYAAWQQFELDSAGLTMTLGCRNLSSRPMPCALALHPYFPCDQATIIDASVATVWTVDELVLPVANVAAEGRYALSDRAICGAGLDNGFEGWGGRVRFDWPGQPVALVMLSNDATRLQIYAPEGQGYFAAEPVQNSNAALNAPQERWEALGVEMLGENAARELRVRFEVM